ncbi:MAG: Citrate synthase (si), partial [uncultured Solirubrobacterales bacterium]
GIRADPAGRRGRRRGDRPGNPLDHRQPHRRDLRDGDHRGHRPGDGLPRDQGQRGRLRPHDLRPRLQEHRLDALEDRLHRRRGRHPRVPRLLDRAALRALELPRDRLSDRQRRAAVEGRVRAVGARDHPPHVRPRERQEADGGLPLRRPPDGDAPVHRRSALDLLPRREQHHRRARAAHGGGPADREDADARRLRLSAQPRASVLLSRQRPELSRELPLDAVQDGRVEVRARPEARARARRALHPPRRPRAERLDRRGAQRRLDAGGSLLGDRRRGLGALRTAPRRGQRAGPPHARPHRHDRQHPRLPRGREEPRGAADGLRPPRLQELRPPRADHQAPRRRGPRGHRQEPEARDRRRARETRARRRVLHRAQAVSERRLLLGPDLRGARDADRHVHGDLRHPADLGVGRAVARARQGRRAGDRAAAADLRRVPRAGVRRDRRAV